MRHKGNTQIEYAIIVVLIALAIIPICIVFGGQIVSYLTSFKNLLSGQNDVYGTVSPVSNQQKITPGSLDGNMKKPVSQCSNNMCTIDYGDFILEGIPEDLGKYVKSHGSSGGSDQIAMIFDQIAQHFEEEGDTQGAKDFRNLANLGHLMADLQEQVEQVGQNCTGAQDEKNCIFEALSTGTYNVSAMENYHLENLLTNFNYQEADISNLIKTSQPTMYNGWKLALSGGSSISNFLSYNPEKNLMGFTAEDLDDIENAFFNKNNNEDSSIGMAYLSVYNKIIDSPKYSDALKHITTQLADETSLIMYDVDKLVHHSRKNADIEGIPYSSLDGKLDMVLIGHDPLNNSNEILHPKSSASTDFRALLMCTTGFNPNTGEKCN